MDDYHQYVPLLVTSMNNATLVTDGHDKMDGSLIFRQKFSNAPSNQIGCRKYVRGALHHIIPDTAYVIDACDKETGTVDLLVNVMKKSPCGKTNIAAGKSLLRVCNISSFSDVTRSIVELGSQIPSKGHVCNNMGDVGSMWQIGRKISCDGLRDEYAIGKDKKLHMPQGKWVFIQAKCFMNVFLKFCR